MDEYHFNQINEHASTILENTGATGLVSEPQLKLTANPKGKNRVS